jgi:hypothetical protein
MDTLDTLALAVPGCDAAPFPASPLDFTRALFSQNGRVHTESRCNRCNFRIVARTSNELDHEEQVHAASCEGSGVE